MGEVVNGIALLHDNDEEEAEKAAASLQMRVLLRALARPLMWQKGAFARAYENEHGSENVESEAEEDEARCDSVRIEAVEDLEMGQPDYGIREETPSYPSPPSERASMTEDDTREVEIKQTLGKRKEPPVCEDVHNAYQQPIASGAIAEAGDKHTTCAQSIPVTPTKPSPRALPASRQVDVPPTPKFDHIDHDAPVPVPPSNPLLCATQTVKTSPPLSKRQAPQTTRLDLEPRSKGVNSSPPSAPTSNSTDSTDTAPIPITPKDSPDGQSEDASPKNLAFPDEAKIYSMPDETSSEISSSSAASPSSDTTAAITLHTHPDRIPWIPMVGGKELGPIASQVVWDVWYDARARLRECRCGVCERAKTRQWEAMGGAWGVAGDGAKRLRLG